mmetsp:Transcript_92/g.132  ORF Transcript_92/g.132 Transcript_92/m.132 type:complete len:203 (-) Transcript_92:1214-1822(-)
MVLRHLLPEPQHLCHHLPLTIRLVLHQLLRAQLRLYHLRLLLPIHLVLRPCRQHQHQFPTTPLVHLLQRMLLPQFHRQHLYLLPTIPLAPHHPMEHHHQLLPIRGCNQHPLDLHLETTQLYQLATIWQTMTHLVYSALDPQMMPSLWIPRHRNITPRRKYMQPLTVRGTLVAPVQIARDSKTLHRNKKEVAGCLEETTVLCQ